MKMANNHKLLNLSFNKFDFLEIVIGSLEHRIWGRF